jgi:hypothetical protein
MKKYFYLGLSVPSFSCSMNLIINYHMIIYKLYHTVRHSYRRSYLVSIIHMDTVRGVCVCCRGYCNSGKHRFYTRLGRLHLWLEVSVWLVWGGALVYSTDDDIF